MNLHSRAQSLVVGCLIAASCGACASSDPSLTSVQPVSIVDAAVQIVADGCRSADVHGAGMMIAQGRVATVAHVVAGATQIEVRSASGTAEATVVYFDPILDVAVLKVDAGLAAPIDIGTAAAGDHGRLIVYRDDAPVELAADIQRLVDIRTADIYGEGKHIRPGYELAMNTDQGDIQAGDSGAVVVVDDKAVALVWATSRQAEGRSWAMRTSLLADHLAIGTPVDNGECA